MPQKIYSENSVLIEKHIFGNLGIFYFSSQKVALHANPGQFVMLKAGDEKDPLLARPFSIFYAKKGIFELLIKKVGITTARIFNLRTGDSVKVTGPLGNGFLDKGKEVILIGGGTGVAPLNFYARRYGFSRFIAGFPSRIDGFFDFLPEGTEIVTEDGSFSEKGYPTDFIDDEETKPVYACGPLLMLKSLEKKRSKSLENTFVSLESMMGCGFGICAGCGVKKRGEEGYFRVCSEGPIFSFSRIAI